MTSNLDANTAALSKHERENASNDAIVDAYQALAIDELTDDIMRGQSCAGMTRIDFVDALLDEGRIRADDLTLVLFESLLDYPAEEARLRIEKHVETDVRTWFIDSVAGQGAVSDLCHELAADDKERHKEERGTSE